METAHLLLPRLLSDAQQTQHSIDWIVGEKLRISWLHDAARAESEERERTCVTVVQVPLDSELQKNTKKRFPMRNTFYMCSAADADGVCCAGRTMYPHFNQRLVRKHVDTVHRRPMQKTIVGRQRKGIYGYVGTGTEDFAVLPGAPMAVD
jgi:hypothetical protein